MSCPICGSERAPITVLKVFNAEDFGHLRCPSCKATYDSNVDDIRSSIPDQNAIEQIDNREDYRRLFVETWEIANEDDEVYSKFEWDDNDRLQEGVLAPALASIEAHYSGRPQAILDLGCGNGFTTKLLANTFGDEGVIGLDPSPLILRTAARTGLRGLQGTLSSVRFDDDQFDVVIIIGNLMLHPDMSETLREAHRITKKDGVIVMDYKNIDSALRRLALGLAAMSDRLARNPFVQRNFINMRFGLGKRHLKLIAPADLFAIEELYSKPPRLLGFSNQSNLTKGWKGMIWRLTHVWDRATDQQAWLHATLRVKK